MKIYRRDFVDGDMVETELASTHEIILEDNRGNRILVGRPMTVSREGWFEVRVLRGVLQVKPQAENSIWIKEDKNV